MAARGDPIIDQPGQDTFTRRLISVSEILADASVPGAERLHALLDHRIVRSGMTGGAGRALLLHMRRRGETQTLRCTQRAEGFRRAEKLDRVRNRVPAFLRGQRFLAHRRVVLAFEKRFQLLQVGCVGLRIGASLIDFT